MDKQAYRQAVDQFGDMVYRIALNQTRCAADADDVTQAVFLKLFTKPPRWLEDVEPIKAADAQCAKRVMGAEGAERAAAATVRGAASSTGPARASLPVPDERLKAWLIRVTVNECKSLWRTLWRRRVELRDITDADGAPLGTTQDTPAFSNPAYEDLYAALAQLPEKCRIVVHLFYFEDYSTRDIAAVLGVKEPTVRTRLARARKILKQQLKEAWQDEQSEPEPEPVPGHDERRPCSC